MIKLRIWDTHCHLINDSSKYSLPALVEGIKATRQKYSNLRLSVMGTRRSVDWEPILELSNKLPDIIFPGIGWHPWYATECVSLKNDLDKIAQAVVLGEFGLDKSGRIVANSTSITLKSTFVTHQLLLFEQQFQYACDKQMPVSLHIVQASGELLKYCRELDSKSAHPHSIILHSFTGSVDIVKQLLQLKHVGHLFYFGVSYTVNCRRGQSTDSVKRMLYCVPDDRILLESDMDCVPDLLLCDNNSTRIMEDAWISVLGVIAECKGWTLEYTADRLWMNAEKAFITKSSS